MRWTEEGKKLTCYNVLQTDLFALEVLRVATISSLKYEIGAQRL